MKENTIQRNGYIDLCRFIAACNIIWLHFGCAPIPDFHGGAKPVYSAALFVEYFFVLSGYYSVAHIEKNKSHISECEKYIGKYVGKKYIHFLPYAVLTTIIQYIWQIFVNGYTFKKAIEVCLMAPFDALLMRETGINMTSVSSVLWYISAMLIALPIILYLLIKYTEVFQNYLIWIAPPLIYGYLVHSFGTLRTVDWGFSIIRAFGSLILGANLYYVTKYFRKVRLKKYIQIILTGIELGLLVLAVAFTTVKTWSKTYLDVFFVFLIYISLLISLSGLSQTKKWNCGFFSYLGKLSLPMYCFHIPVIQISNYFFSEENIWIRIGIVTVGTIVFSMLIDPLVEKWLRPQWPRIKKMVLVQEK